MCVFFLGSTQLWLVGTFLSVKQHIHYRFNLFTHMNNLLNLIRYFLTLTLPHSRTNLCVMEAGLSQRQCIISATLAGSAVKDNIRSARGQPASEPFVESTYGPAAPAFFPVCRDVAPGFFWEQRCIQLCYRAFTTQVKLDGVRAFSSI